MMQYRAMKSTGDRLSALGFGCMRLPVKGVGIDEERTIKQIRYAIDKGVNYLDTALDSPGASVLFFVARPGVNAFMNVSRWRNLRKARL